jgi:hypothetical protein
MAYKLLGVIVWKGAKWFVRRKYGTEPRSVLAGALLGALATGVLLAARASRSG